MKNDFVYHINQMLQLAKEAFDSNPYLTEETGAVNVKGDKSIKMDVKIEQVFIDYIKKNNLPVNIFSEEIGTLKFHSNPKFLVAFDPLDGSTNYKVGKNLLTYGTLIAYYKGVKPKLENILASGALEATRNLAWIYDGKTTKDLMGNKVLLKNDWKISKSTPVYLDLYYKEGYEKYSALPQKIFIRNTGSTIGNLSYLLSNVAAGLGGICMRAEEIGAVYSLIKGAGGIALNSKGEDLGKEFFDAEKTYPILAGCKNIMEFCLEEIK